MRRVLPRGEKKVAERRVEKGRSEYAFYAFAALHRDPSAWVVESVEGEASAQGVRKGWKAMEWRGMADANEPNSPDNALEIDFEVLSLAIAKKTDFCWLRVSMAACVSRLNTTNSPADL